MDVPVKAFIITIISLAQLKQILQLEDILQFIFSKSKKIMYLQTLSSHEFMIPVKQHAGYSQEVWRYMLRGPYSALAFSMKFVRQRYFYLRIKKGKTQFLMQ